MGEVMLLTISGRDRPGLTASLMAILAEYDVGILDIGQAVIHNTLSLGLLIRLPAHAARSPVLKDVLFHLHELGMGVRFTPVSDAAYEAWADGAGLPRYIFTLLGRRVTAAQIGQVAAVISANGLNIEDISRLSGRAPLHRQDRFQRACIELTARGEPLDADAMKERFLEIAQALDVDIAFQRDNVFRRYRRLVAFDMDSTLIQQEVIDELARHAGVGEEVAAITEAAMRGELDFRDSLRRRVGLLAGLPVEVLERVAAGLVITEGAERLLSTLKAFGFRTAILSGGFDYFGERLQRQLGVDHVHANRLEIRDGRLTGGLVGPVVDGQRKADLLRQLASEAGLSLEQTVAVGDGANDLPMLRSAGLGIAFRAKPLVKRSASQSLSTIGLDGVLYLIGIRDAEARIGSAARRT
jgi:phosphoserine phosphatase